VPAVEFRASDQHHRKTDMGDAQKSIPTPHIRRLDTALGWS
jgi:hypothetical protein